MANLPAIIQEKGLPVIKTAQELITEVHEVFKPEHFNIMVPKAMNISPRVMIAIQFVELDPNPDLYKNKDFWGFPKAKGKESPDDEVIFHARAIRKLAAAANVQFIPSETGIVDAEYDKEGRPLRIRTKASCQTINSLGNIRRGSGDYEYNYKNDLSDPRFEEYRWENKKKVRLGTPDMDQINRRRNNADRSTITGAKMRAYFDCLGIDNTISRKDVGKPFIVPCVMDNIDYSDPIVRKAIAARSVGAQQDTYGDGDGQKLQPVQAESQVVDGGREVDTRTGEVTQQPQEPPAEPKAEPKAPVQIPRDVYEKDWKTSSSEERAKEIKRLADMAKFDITKDSKGKPRVSPDEWADVDQMNWLMYLAQLAGKIPAA